MFFFYIKILKEKQKEMKRKRGDIERDGKKRGDFLIPSNKH